MPANSVLFQLVFKLVSIIHIPFDCVSVIALHSRQSVDFYPPQTGNFKQAFTENNIGGGLNLKNNNLLTSTPLFKNQNSGIGYPEVTLHPIGQSSHSSLLHNQKNNNNNSNNSDHLPDGHANSLLHGILTKVIHSFHQVC